MLASHQHPTWYHNLRFYFQIQLTITFKQPGQTSFAPGPTGADGCVAGACEASAMANCGLARIYCFFKKNSFVL